MDQPTDHATSPPPQARVAPRRGLLALIGALLLVGAFGVLGVTSAFAASPTPSASGGASGAPTATHPPCERATSSPGSTAQ
ncbi:MAG: hypothetical protein M3Y88_06530 [Chloroflexota bacterium]|nr:hypothetical protein [Chloroflexota bacterium]